MENSRRLLIRLLLFCIFTAVYSVLVSIIVISQWQSFSAESVGFVVLAIALLMLFAIRFSRSISRDIQALEIAVMNLSDNNFSVSLPKPKLPEMQGMVDLLNQAFQKLRQQRRNIYQKEFLLNKVIENAPMAMVSCDGQGQILFANIQARRLFNEGRAMQGSTLAEVLANSSDVFSRVISQGVETLFHLDREGERISYHFSYGEFNIDLQAHKLYLFKEVTREINRQEVASWKTAIKVISHELNNSLAPISSMAHSSKLLLEKGDKSRLLKTLGQIEASVNTLDNFIQRYAKFARLPMPNLAPVDWADLLLQLQANYKFRNPSSIPDWTFNADTSQLLQALINVLKNAHESGSKPEDIGMDITLEQGKTLISVYDRGAGMTQSVMEKALVPFYSTKALGSGIGLTLCQEIVEAHYGKMSLLNRNQGGLRVSLLF